jgi:DNA-binding transcriptional ArsR family regulator
MSTSLTVSVLRQAGQASTLFSHPLRLKLLELLIEPDSASGLARRLGAPRQMINYHLRELEGAGLVQFVEARARRGLTERLVHATARSFLISPEVMAGVEPDPARLRDRFSWAYLVAAAAKIVRDLGILRGRADRVGKSLATFTLETEVRFASAGDRDAFTRELAAKVAELSVRYHDERAPRGRLFRFMLGAYPAITKTDDQAAAETAASLPDEEPRS